MLCADRCPVVFYGAFWFPICAHVSHCGSRRPQRGLKKGPTCLQHCGWHNYFLWKLEVLHQATRLSSIYLFSCFSARLRRSRALAVFSTVWAYQWETIAQILFTSFYLRSKNLRRKTRSHRNIFQYGISKVLLSLASLPFLFSSLPGTERRERSRVLFYTTELQYFTVLQNAPRFL